METLKCFGIFSVFRLYFKMIYTLLWPVCLTMNKAFFTLLKILMPHNELSFADHYILITQSYIMHVRESKIFTEGQVCSIVAKSPAISYVEFLVRDIAKKFPYLTHIWIEKKVSLKFYLRFQSSLFDYSMRLRSDKFLISLGGQFLRNIFFIYSKETNDRLDFTLCKKMATFFSAFHDKKQNEMLDGAHNHLEYIFSTI